MVDVREFYDREIRSRSAVERLQLATLILNDIRPQSIVDYDDVWSNADLKEFTTANWSRIDDEIEVDDA